jgi:hypothetical protein
LSDYSEYRTHEQDVDRRAEQARVAREHQDAARRQAAERRAAERGGRARTAGTARPRVA